MSDSTEKCAARGCEREATYIAAQLCQKHYFRVRRTGTTKTRAIVRGTRHTSHHGYVQERDPEHPLAMGNGSVWLHRKALYDARYGVPDDCELCGKSVNWWTGHVDHINRDRADNRVCNLRLLCPGCNVSRDRAPAHTRGDCMAITAWGETKTPNEWARDPRARVGRAGIKRRVEQGEPPELAISRPRERGPARKFEALRSAHDTP